MQISPAEIRELVEEGDDFGHEMRVGRVMRGYRGSQLAHGGTYSDPVTTKTRQFDYRWRLASGTTVLHLPVECKNLHPGAPLIICGCKRTPRESFHDIVESRAGRFHLPPAGHTVVETRHSGIIRRITMESSIYQPDSFVGKNLLRLKPVASGGQKTTTRRRYTIAKDTEIYDEWSQALTSAHDLVRDACDRARPDTTPHVYTAILPIVVVPDNVLWQLEYDINGAVTNDPELVNGCEFYVSNDVPLDKTVVDSLQSFTMSHVHFLTLKGFASFLLTITDDQEWRERLFHDSALRASRDERA